MSQWYDTHVHLDRYPKQERMALLDRADEAGVAIIAVATDLASSAEVLRMLGSHPALVGCAVGIHPKNAGHHFEESLFDIARTPGVLAVGECGFDGIGPPWQSQVEAFNAQCRIARELDLALVLHIGGEGAFRQLERQASVLTGPRVVRHYFAGDGAQAAWHRERGHYLSFGNPLTRQPNLQAIAREYPPELLLIETDSYPLPGRTTEPADIVRVGETLAPVRGWTVEATYKQLARNTRAAFGLNLP